MGLTALSHLQPVDNTNRDLYDYEVLAVEHLQQGCLPLFTSGPRDSRAKYVLAHEHTVEKYDRELPVRYNEIYIRGGIQHFPD